MKANTTPTHKLGANRNEAARKPRKPVTNFSQSRDVREDRCARQEKFVHQPHTVIQNTPGGKITGSPAKFAGSAGHRRVVTFHHPTAKKVTIAGTFNGWHPEATPLRNVEGNKWATELLLDTGTYEYRFLVDGKWADDPAGTAFVSNEFGGKNAVLDVRTG